MKYIAVKHKPEHRDVFWFAVPETLEDKVFAGSKVICNTKYGDASGEVVWVLEGYEQRDAESIVGNFFPLKSIIAVEVECDVEDIHIPYDLAMSNPSPNKIAKRMAEYYDSGKFSTPTIFAPDFTLRDGYTAYLVAKMFGHDTLRGFCLAK